MKMDSDFYTHQWRVTKYDPAKRDQHGNFSGDDWVMAQEIGSVFDGKIFTKDEYLKAEDRYVTAAEEFFRESGLKTLIVRSLEQSDELADHIIEHGLNDIKNIRLNEGQHVMIEELGPIIRLLLRDILWCKLEYPKNFFIHIGWDYYMFIGCSKDLVNAVAKTNASGLYVEDFISPYFETE